MVTPYPLKFFPIPKERIWGGHKLKGWFRCQEKEPIGEYWVLSSHPNGMSVVANGAFKGMTLQELTEKYPEYYLGNSPQKRFPLLIKFLDITQDLSVQVHPDDEYAQLHEDDFGKTESWYILDTKKDGSIIYGHHFKNKQEFQSAVKEKKVRDYLNYVPIKPRQSILVPSRTLHALLADTTLLEVQQTSDVTYRVYDWDRVDSEGKSRPLHVEKAGEVLCYGKKNISIQSQRLKNSSIVVNQGQNIQDSKVIQCPYFMIEKINYPTHSKHHLSLKNKNPNILVVCSGNGSLLWNQLSISLDPGDTILCPNHISQNYQIETKNHLEIVRITYPTIN